MPVSAAIDSALPLRSSNMQHRQAFSGSLITDTAATAPPVAPWNTTRGRSNCTPSLASRLSTADTTASRPPPQYSSILATLPAALKLPRDMASAASALGRPTSASKNAGHRLRLVSSTTSSSTTRTVASSAPASPAA